MQLSVPSGFRLHDSALLNSGLVRVRSYCKSLSPSINPLKQAVWGVSGKLSVLPRLTTPASSSMPASTESYSLWLMPRGEVASKAGAYIEELAARVDDAPTFAPHVTLLGGIRMSQADVMRITEELAGKIQPYTISLGKVSFGAIFHQCVYLLCNQDDAAMHAGRLAREAFGMDPSSPYMPHLSLLYSNIDQGQREELAAELQGGCRRGDGGGMEAGV